VTASPTLELRALAERIVDLLPLEAADDVVLAGSVSRGVADAGSDVELLLFRDELPALDVARDWASRAGIEVTSLWESTEVGYVAGAADGTAIELLWLTPETLESLLERASAGELVDHRRLPVFEALQHGIALRGLRLRMWQERLRTYPESLREALIHDAVDDWGGYLVGIYTRQAWRNDRYALRRVSLEVADDILRLLFALNRRWEPTWKRLPQLLEPLPLKPERTAERIEAALSAEGREAMLTLFELARDAVALVPRELDVERARTWLDDAVELLR
jgi:hypothetical protein